MRWMLPILALSAALLSGQTPDADVRLTIRVLDTFTGAGVPNATLYVHGEDSDSIVNVPDTDAMGLSSAMETQKSSFEILAGASGYPVAHSVAVIGHQALTVTIAFVRAATLFGTVV